MSFQDQIIEAAKGLSQEGDSVEVVPAKRKPKQYKCCNAAHQILKRDGISVSWDTNKSCAVVCKGTPAPAPAPAPEPTEEGKDITFGPSKLIDWGFEGDNIT